MRLSAGSEVRNVRKMVIGQRGNEMATTGGRRGLWLQFASLSDGGGGLGRDGMSAAAREAEGATQLETAATAVVAREEEGGNNMRRKMVGGVWLLERRVRLQPMQGWQRLCGSDEGCEQKAAVAWGGRRGSRDGNSSRWWGGEGRWQGLRPRRLWLASDGKKVVGQQMREERKAAAW
ncbi:hypothetical protein BHE74_00057837 [Ensete ventricosum]|nr:hypothetical protein BHE74_00057837 [Ensete ventricosum]